MQTILIVDDDENIGNLEQEVLERAGYGVRRAYSGTVSFSNAAKKLDVVQTERLFDRFFTVETGGGSTGLGLSISKLLTEKMGGSIAAEYREGRLIVSLEFNECE